MARYRVVDGTQVHHAEVTYGAGEEFEAQPTRAGEWLALGLVVAVDASGDEAPKRPARR